LAVANQRRTRAAHGTDLWGFGAVAPDLSKASIRLAIISVSANTFIMVRLLPPVFLGPRI
jgi:hypothetical protein